MLTAPMCVQATYWTQEDKEGRRTIIQLFNGLNTTANHGLPAAEVPFARRGADRRHPRLARPRSAQARSHLEPGGHVLEARRAEAGWYVEVPSLALHALWLRNGKKVNPRTPLAAMGDIKHRSNWKSGRSLVQRDRR